MAGIQQQQQVNDAVPQSWGTGSNRIAAINVEGETPPSIISSNNTHRDHEEANQQKPGWRKLLSYVGPGFLVSMAYMDPGNMETDLQAGASYGFQLLWVILLGTIFGLILQSLCANLGVCTGKHLAELCKAEYPKYVTFCLCLLAESACIAADVPEVIGTASALHLLLHIPLWVGVICTGFSTLLFLGVQRYGVRKLELLITVMICVMAACFFGELGYVKPPAASVLEGMFVPKLSGQTTGNAIALLGQLIQPNNLFLHSAVVLSRKVPDSVRGINAACRYFLLETGFALFVAFLINVAIISVSGTVCSAPNISSDTAQQCGDINLSSASFLLKNVLGKSSSIIYGIALLASGQSASITATYAGQFVMEGFLDLKMRNWLRNLLTRGIAIIPSLIASIIGGPSAAGQLIIIASIILSFQLPFAVIPLLKFSSSTTKMGPHTNSIYVIVISWLLGMGMIGINIYYLITAFVGWLLHNNLPKVGNVLIGIIVFPLMALYIISLIYLIFRKDTVVTFIQPTKDDPIAQAQAQAQMENGLDNPSELDHVPYREDLADIPFPN